MEEKHKHAIDKVQKYKYFAKTWWPKNQRLYREQYTNNDLINHARNKVHTKKKRQTMCSLEMILDRKNSVQRCGLHLVNHNILLTANIKKLFSKSYNFVKST